jgi:hypothetical protein
MTQLSNRIITKGFGPSRGQAGRSGPITQGYGSPPIFVVEALRRNLELRVRPGGSSGRKQQISDIQEVIVWAKLIEINGRQPIKNIENQIVVKLDQSKRSVAIEHISSRIRKFWEDFKVTVKRIK